MCALRFTLQNTSEEALIVTESSPITCRPVLLNSAGEELTPIGWLLGGSSRRVEVQPGESLAEDCPFARLYPQVADGEYTLLAKCHVPRLDGEGSAQVESAPIAISVSGGQISQKPSASVASATAKAQHASSGRGRAPSSARGAVREGFQLLLDLPESPPTAEAPVLLRLGLQNVSDQVLLVAESSPQHDYRLSVATASGETVAPTRDPGPIERRVLREVLPGEVLVDQYDLTKMYGVLPDGGYSIVARRCVLRLDGEGTVEIESARIAISVSRGQVWQIPSTPAASPAAKVESASQPPLVAVRAILERHGFQVAWDANGRALKAAKGSSLAVIAAGSSVMSFAGQDLRMGREARLIEGRLCAPGNAISLLTWIMHEG
jgi:hypothetical protein